MNSQGRHGFTCKRCKNNLISSLLYVAVLLSPTHSQNTINDVSVLPTSNPAKVSTTLTPTTITSAFQSTMFVSSLSFPPTSSASSPTDQVLAEFFPTTTPVREGETHDEAVFNYYFLFLVFFGVLVAGLLWWLQREKKRRKERMRLGGQHALARDLEGWVTTRRFMHGRYGRYHHSAPARYEEGLDEHGEAPPPYQPKSDHAVAGIEVGATHDMASTVTIPLRTLSRDGMDRSRPPVYHDSYSGTLSRGRSFPMNESSR